MFVGTIILFILFQRAELLEKLAKVQAKPEELEFLNSTAFVQTHGLKKYVSLAFVCFISYCYLLIIILHF